MLLSQVSFKRITYLVETLMEIQAVYVLRTPMFFRVWDIENMIFPWIPAI